MKITEVIVAVCGVIIKIALAIAVVTMIYRGARLAYDYGIVSLKKNRYRPEKAIRLR